MKRTTYKKDGSTLVEDAIPECGKDFCYGCGDCLACYWEDECEFYDDGHVWVVYEDPEDDELKLPE